MLSSTLNVVYSGQRPVVPGAERLFDEHNLMKTRLTNQLTPWSVMVPL
jgi:hypothetical protein